MGQPRGDMSQLARPFTVLSRNPLHCPTLAPCAPPHRMGNPAFFSTLLKGKMLWPPSPVPNFVVMLGRALRRRLRGQVGAIARFQSTMVSPRLAGTTLARHPTRGGVSAAAMRSFGAAATTDITKTALPLEMPALSPTMKIGRVRVGQDWWICVPRTWLVLWLFHDVIYVHMRFQLTLF